MHILIVAVSSSTAPSGICRHAANLAISLVASTDISRVTLLVGKWQESYFNDAFGLNHTKVDVVPVNIRRNAVIRNLWYFRKLSQLATEYRADVVHLSFPAPIVRKHFRCPVVSSIHDLYPYDIPANFGRTRSVLNRAFLRQCLRESDFLVCVSDFTLSRLRSIVGLTERGKAAKIYPFVCIDTTHVKEPVFLELQGQRFILTVAQHRRNKNLPALLSAFADLRQRHEHHDLKLLVVGSSGPETAHLHRLTRQLYLDNSVAFARGLSNEELCWLYKNCGLFVAPSLIEGFGHPVREALQCGSRVLCSNIPVFREVGGAECHYFDILGEPLAAILADAMAHAMTQPPAKVADWDRFSSHRAATQHVALYSALTASSSKGGVENIQHVLIPNEPIQQSRVAS